MTMPAPTQFVILVVENDSFLRIFAATMLTDRGFEVIEADNVDIALGVLRNGTVIHAVFSDLQMRGSLNGLDLARIVRREFPLVSVVVMSVHYMPKLGELAPGALFFSKPYDESAVVDALRLRNVSVEPLPGSAIVTV
jgi:two-component system, response regulator PdtaR